MTLLAIAPAGRSEAYRFRNERGEIVGHSSVPVSDEGAYDYAAGLAARYNYLAIYIERRVYVIYPWKVQWVNLLFYWDEKEGDIAA